MLPAPGAARTTGGTGTGDFPPEGPVLTGGTEAPSCPVEGIHLFLGERADAATGPACGRSRSSTTACTAGDDLIVPELDVGHLALLGPRHGQRTRSSG